MCEQISKLRKQNLHLKKWLNNVWKKEKKKISIISPLMISLEITLLNLKCASDVINLKTTYSKLSQKWI